LRGRSALSCRARLRQCRSDLALDALAHALHV
jgi:hypothetical protein